MEILQEDLLNRVYVDYIQELGSSYKRLCFDKELHKFVIAEYNNYHNDFYYKKSLSTVEAEILMQEYRTKQVY